MNTLKEMDDEKVGETIVEKAEGVQGGGIIKKRKK